jgi:hypothetical protein
MPLPCTRDLWKASTVSRWKMEYAAMKDGDGGVNQPTYGDLMKLRFTNDNKLDSWISQLDDFGTLVVTAAVLPE